MSSPKPFKLTLMQERLAGLAVGAGLAVPAWVWLAPRFFGVHTEGDPLAGAAVFTYAPTVILATAVVGLAIGVAGFLVGTDRQFWNFALVGAGAGLLLFGTTWFAAERLELTPEGFAYRSWWGLSSRRFAFDDLAEVTLQSHTRGWVRRRSWLSLRYQTKGGETGTLCGNTGRNPLWFWAAPHLVRMSRRGILTSAVGNDCIRLNAWKVAISLPHCTPGERSYDDHRHTGGESRLPRCYRRG